MKTRLDSLRADEAAEAGRPCSDKTSPAIAPQAPSRQDVEAAVTRLVEAILPEPRAARRNTGGGRRRAGG